MERTIATSLAVAGVTAGALAIAVVVRLVNRPHDRQGAGFSQRLLRAAAKWFKGPSWSKLSRERKAVHLAGLMLASLGVAFILSIFATMLAGFGTIDGFQAPSQLAVSRGLGGLVLVAVGRCVSYLAMHGVPPDET